MENNKRKDMIAGRFFVLKRKIPEVEWDDILEAGLDCYEEEEDQSVTLSMSPMMIETYDFIEEVIPEMTPQDIFETGLAETFGFALRLSDEREGNKHTDKRIEKIRKKAREELEKEGMLI